MLSVLGSVSESLTPTATRSQLLSLSYRVWIHVLSLCDFSDLIQQIIFLWLDYIQTTESSDHSASLSASVSSFEDPIAV